MTDEERELVKKAISEGKPPWAYIPRDQLPRDDDHLIVLEVVKRANEEVRKKAEEN